MSAVFKDGNRLPCPDEVKSKHFFYKAKPVDLDQALVEKVVDAATKHVEMHGLNPAEIAVLRNADLEKHVDGAGFAFDDLLRTLTVGEARSDRLLGGILVCDWANPHSDTSYAGKAFLSQVLSTGPEPYIMQTFHIKATAGSVRSQRLESSTRCLNKGDLFVFDPTTAHMVAPRRSGQGQLLIMLQAVLVDETADDRNIILSQYPPLASDKDEDEVFNGY